MNDKIVISGFADEIDPKLDEQLKVVTGLGMNYISLRAADGKGIADYTVEEAKESLLPRLQAAGVKVSSLGSPIGKVGIEDEEGFEKQLAQLDTLCQICQVLDCRYIRMFSFFIPEGKNPDDYHDQVLEKLKKFAVVAEKYNVVLIHENEKEIYGDIGRRCKVVLDAVGSDHFKAAFDFANFVQCGQDTWQAWTMLAPRTKYLHIKDALRDGTVVPAGRGEGNVARIVAAFRAQGGAHVTVEPHLQVFSGLEALEQAGARSGVGAYAYGSADEAFDAACAALRTLI